MRAPPVWLGIGTALILGSHSTHKTPTAASDINDLFFDLSE
jgi:hypothetical protein